MEETERCRYKAMRFLLQWDSKIFVGEPREKIEGGKQNYIVSPEYARDRWISFDAAFKVNVISFFDVIQL